MSYQLPDTYIVKEAKTIVQAAISPNIWNHSLRTYFLANSYGKNKAISFDAEELALVSLFHDIGLYLPYHRKGKAFQVNSSLALKDFLTEEKGIGKARINVMMEAIDFHMQLFPRWHKDDIVGLLQVGAYMDVTGIKASAIEKATRKAILKQYPKGNLFLEFNTCLLKSIKGIKSITGIVMPHTCQDVHHYH